MVRSVVRVMRVVAVWSGFVNAAYETSDAVGSHDTSFSGVLTALRGMEWVCASEGEGSEKESGFYVMTKEAMEQCCDDFSASVRQLKQEFVVAAREKECSRLRQLLLEGQLIQAQKMQKACEESAKRMQEGLLRVCAMQRKKIIALQKMTRECDAEERLVGEADIGEDWLLTERG